jgi:hypothetical protein
MAHEAEQFYSWLCANDARLKAVTSLRSGDGVESFLEHLLWENTASFVSGPLRTVRYGTLAAGDAIQYLSYPLFSHFKRVERQEPNWISRFPLYFGGRGSVSSAVNVIGRYSTLYRGLLSHSTGFSFTGFVGNPSLGLERPPRFVVMELKNASRPAMSVTSDHDVLVLRASIPAPRMPRLRHLQIINEYASSDAAVIPTLCEEFSGGRFVAFWEWFKEMTSTPECHESASDLNDASSEIEQLCAPVLLPELRSVMHAPSVEDTAKGLARFMAWNVLLGFRRLVYVPFRTIEPVYPGEPDVISWGGIILALNNRISLDRRELNFLSVKYLQPRTKRRPQRLAPLIAATKLLVDVATSRASIGDWKYYQRSYEQRTLRRTHAEGMMYGFGQEIRNLQALVAAAIEDDELLGVVTRELRVGADIATLLMRAYTEQEHTVSLHSMLGVVRQILRWTDFGIRSKLDRQAQSVVTLVPILFVITELCRNAYKFGKAAGKTKKKVAIVSFSIERGHLAELVVSNRSDGERMFKRYVVGEWSRPPQYHGHDLVANIVCDILLGSFSFKRGGGMARATISLPVHK